MQISQPLLTFPRLLHRHVPAAAITHTGNTSKTELYSWTLPAGTLGPRDTIRIETSWGGTGTAGIKTTGIEFGGTAFFQTPVSAANISNGTVLTMIHNRASLSAQIGGSAITSGAGAGSSSGALPTGAINTANAVDIKFYVTLVNGADVFGLAAALIWHIPG